MKYELKVIADSKEELLELLCGACVEEPKEAPQDGPPKEEAPKAEEPLQDYTLEAVQKAFGDLAKAGMKSDLKELLSHHGVKKVSELPPEEYGNIMDELEELLKGVD